MTARIVWRAKIARANQNSWKDVLGLIERAFNELCDFFKVETSNDLARMSMMAVDMAFDVACNALSARLEDELPEECDDAVKSSISEHLLGFAQMFERILASGKERAQIPHQLLMSTTVAVNASLGDSRKSPLCI